MTEGQTLSREEAIARYREAQPEAPLVTCDGRLLEAPIGYYCLITPFPDAPEEECCRILLHSGHHRNFDYLKRGLSDRQVRRLRNKLNRYDIVGLDPETDVKYDPVLQAFSDIRIVGIQERPGCYWKRFPRDGEGEQYVECGSVNALIGDDTDHLVQLIEEQQSLYHVGAVEDETDRTVRDVFRNSVMAYEIIRSDAADKDGETGEGDGDSEYYVRYYPAKELVQRFVSTDTAGGRLDRIVSHGVMLEDEDGIRAFPSYTDAASFMAAHFKERAERIWHINDPFTLTELLQNGRVWLNRQVHGVKHFWDRHDVMTFSWLTLIFGLRTAHRLFFGQLGNRLEQGIGYLESLGLKACEAVQRTRRQSRIESGESASPAPGPEPEDFTIKPPAGRVRKDLRYAAVRTADLLRNRKVHINTRCAHIADPGWLRCSKVLNAEQAGVIAGDHRLHPADLGHWRACKWLYNIYSGHQGAIVFPRNDSVRTVQHANGLLVDHVPGSDTAFVRFRPQFRRRGAPRLPEGVYELVDGVDRARDKVIEIGKDCDGMFFHRPLSLAEYRSRVYRITGNRNWLGTPSNETLEPAADIGSVSSNSSA